MSDNSSNYLVVTSHFCKSCVKVHILKVTDYITWANQQKMMLSDFFTCGLYYKNITIIRMTIVSDAPSCGVTYDGHSNDIYALIVISYAPREHL